MTAGAGLLRGAVASSRSFDVELLADFSTLGRRHPTLREDVSGSDFFSTWHWFENLSSNGLEPDLRRMLVVIRDTVSGAAFCLPMLRRRRGAAAVAGPVACSLSNYYSSLFGVLGDPRHVSVDALRAAFAYLRRHLGTCGVIDLQPLDSGDAFYRMALEALAAEGFLTDTYFCFGNWHLDVAGRSFALYEASIPSRLRTKRVSKRLDRAGAWKVDVHTAPGPALDAAIVDFEAIYARSWRTPEPYPGFVAGLCRSTAQRGWLRLGVLRLDDVPIAAQLWLIKDRKALIYKIAYDEAFKTLSAGSVLSSVMMRRSIDEEVVVDVDYLTGDDNYKADWMSHRRERVGIVAFHKHSVLGRASWLRHVLGRWWRSRRTAVAPTPDERRDVMTQVPLPAPRGPTDERSGGCEQTAAAGRRERLVSRRLDAATES